ncbi:hypothetical protein [Psychrobacter sp. AOP7-B1-24]|uniref:hypothetical protein n=1 Tax=Psychrobacter sp. AOP7-B1-24 TaxID=3457645 RepID=UPI00402BA683
MSIKLTNLIGFFQSNKELEHNQTKAIQLLQTMQWSKLCWDESWEEVIALESLLPEVGKTHSIKLDENEDYAEEGKAYILWLPPHSELNGWYDKRPSEILKAYVLEGDLSNATSNYENREYFFDFQVTSRTRLIDCFVNIHETESVYVPYFLKYKDSLASTWENVQDLEKCKVGNYLYIHGVKPESSFELILSYEKEKICLHYSATLYHPADYETVITRYFLNDKEQKLFEKLIEKASEITDTSMNSLEGDQIYGAEYW